LTTKAAFRKAAFRKSRAKTVERLKPLSNGAYFIIV